MIAVTSAGGSSGVTTTGLALAYTWPSPVLLAEAAHAGGQILAGHARGRFPAERGLWPLLRILQAGGVDGAVAGLAGEAWQLNQSVLLLPGMPDPFRARQVPDAAWVQLAEVFGTFAERSSPPCEVIVDVGPVDGLLPFPLVRYARMVLMVLRPTLGQVWAARSRLDMLRRLLGDDVPIALVLVGEGEHTEREVAELLGPFALMGRLPNDQRTAAFLSDGQQLRGTFPTRPLIRQAGLLAATLARTLPTFVPPIITSAPAEARPSQPTVGRLTWNLGPSLTPGGTR